MKIFLCGGDGCGGDGLVVMMGVMVILEVVLCLS